MAKPIILKLTIPEALAGQRLDKALAQLAAGDALSRVRLQNLIAEGQVSRNGTAVVEGTYKVRMDEIYTVSVPPPEPAEPHAQKMPLKIVYEDKDLLVIDKPAGMVVHPAPGNRDKTLVNALLAHCGKSLSGIGGVARPGIVHRLDKDTSGLMVVAKSDKAHQALSKQFSDRSLSRTYHALVWGVPTPLAGEIEAPIGRHMRDRKKMAVSGKGKPALTYYAVKRVYGIASLVECNLATGRTHQIRVHLAHRKHHVIGDPVYGRRKTVSADKIVKALQAFPRQALHAVELRFQHPLSKKMLRFKSDMPREIKQLQALLAKAVRG
ncbi:MAG: RluA family pseudouridine synthase [Bdellovibrionales bacterium]